MIKVISSACALGMTIYHMKSTFGAGQRRALRERFSSGTPPSSLAVRRSNPDDYAAASRRIALSVRVSE